ncbi:MAG TPA: hypothetical protein VF035_01265 [Longimicrobiales bacterium]
MAAGKLWSVDRGVTGESATVVAAVAISNVGSSRAGWLAKRQSGHWVSGEAA